MSDQATYTISVRKDIDASQTKPWLECRQLSASYPEFKLSMDFTINEGEIISIIGPSGCGKSTLLQLISGLMTPDSGTMVLGGADITDKEVWTRNIAMVFQDYALFPHMTVAQNIGYPLKLRKVDRKSRKASIEALLSLVGLQGYEKRKTGELSGGERQRVALARALASKPCLLLLDEPLSALDAQLRKHLRREIKRIHQETGITTIHVTHDQEEALSMSDRILVMHEGTMEQLDTPQAVYERPATLFAASFMGEGTVLPYEVVKKTLTASNTFSETEYDETRQLFFRPEQMIVHDDPSLPFPDFLPHLRFKDAYVANCEYQGSSYLLECIWDGHTILARTNKEPKHPNVTLGVRYSELVCYEGGVIVR